MKRELIESQEIYGGNWQGSEKFYERYDNIADYRIYFAEALGESFACDIFQYRLMKAVQQNPKEIMVFFNLKGKRLSAEWSKDSEGKDCLVVVEVVW